MENSEKTPWEQWKENLGETRPWDLVKTSTIRADEEKAKNRYDICLSCPELIQLTKQCKKCGCFMAAKTKIEKAVCPLGKW